MTNQQRIAREFFGWRQSANFSVFWRAPGDQGDVPTRRMPNLKTEVGAALWVELIEAELERRRIAFCIDWLPRRDWSVQLIHGAHSIWQIEEDGPTKLAALTAAVLKLMESEK